MRKKAVFTILGMNRDLAMSKFDARFAYENKNLRLITDESNSKLVMTNERGPKPIVLYKRFGNDYAITSIQGSVIGICVVNEHMVLFTHKDNSEDYIYRLGFEGNRAIVTLLYQGKLGFNMKYPIEALSFYENEKIQKVYWTDGINQPRVINIMDTTTQYDDGSFDFAQKIGGLETISVTRVDNANGLFACGTIQYCFTYYRNYGQETNIVRISSINYVSPDDRGGINESVGCLFNIKLENLDKRFDGVRIYSLHRTSIDTASTVKRITDYSIPSSGTINFNDTGTIGDDVASTDLLYVGSKDIRVQTIAQKDNTLFMGNIVEKHSVISETLKKKLKNQAYSSKGFENNVQIDLPTFAGYYPYKSQLSSNAHDIKYFKYGETYRFGVQLQDRFGNWSDVVRIEGNDGSDFIQILRPYNSLEEDLRINPNLWNGTGLMSEPKMRFAEFVANLDLTRLVDEDGNSLVGDYVAIRPVVVYPDQQNRTIVAQGILCPTIYNLEDRVVNHVAGMVSWFARPIGKFHTAEPSTIMLEKGATRFDNLEYRHMCPIPCTNEYLRYDETTPQYGYASRAEIACNFDGKYSPDGSSRLKKATDYSVWANLLPTKDKVMPLGGSEIVRAEQLSAEFFVDQSILSFHSPEIEFDRRSQTMSYDDVQMRIVGIVPITSTSQNIHVNLEDADSEDVLYLSNYHFDNRTTESQYSKWQMSELGGIRGDFDYTVDESGGTGYLGNWRGLMKIYPWHTKTLTYNDTDEKYDYSIIYDTKIAEGYVKPKIDTQLKTKCYDTLHYSYTNLYCINSGLDIDIAIPNLYLTENSGMIRLNSVDGFGENPMDAFNFDMDVDRTIIGKTHKLRNDGEREVLNTQEYAVGFVPMSICRDVTHSTMNREMESLQSTCNIHATEGVSMKYKTTSCAVLQLVPKKVDGIRYMNILPSFGSLNRWKNECSVFSRSSEVAWYGDTAPNEFSLDACGTNSHFLWDKDKVLYGVKQDSITDCFPLNADGEYYVSDSINSNNIGYFYIAELYRKNVVNRFGGNTEEAIAANIWIPCGKAVSIRNGNGDLLDSIKIRWSEGDTYYQRYDNLHTYPYTFDDVNQIVDITSFMVETRVNIDGRYDKNRGKRDNESMSPINFNKLNEVYSQSDNAFQYRSIDERRIVVNEWPDYVAWSETKIPGEINDKWTNITLGSTIALDGVKGAVRALRSLTNNIFAFQDSAICRVLYNENYAVTADNGVPLTIANSGKVSNKHYVSESVGCRNKWSIVNTPSGIYFMDDLMRDIYLMNGEGSLSSIGVSRGFGSWVKANSDSENTWYPNSLTNLRSLFDKRNGEVMFVTDESALSFNELFSGFTSFYDYQNTSFLENLTGHNIMTRENNGETLLFEHNEGVYNCFFGIHKHFYTEIICHSDGSEKDSSLLDKTWMNVGFIFDSFDNDVYQSEDRFDRVEVCNEYQHGETSWPSRFYPTIDKQFRYWSGDIPRDEDNPQDRIRSQWAKIRLTKDSDLDKEYKSLIHSIDISYNE